MITSYIQECKINQKISEQQELQRRRVILLEEISVLDKNIADISLDIRKLKNEKLWILSESQGN